MEETKKNTTEGNLFTSLNELPFSDYHLSEMEKLTLEDGTTIDVEDFFYLNTKQKKKLLVLVTKNGSAFMFANSIVQADFDELLYENGEAEVKASLPITITFNAVKSKSGRTYFKPIYIYTR